MKSLKYYAIILCVALSANSFAQNKACTGAEFTTNSQYYRASSNGSSVDITASKKKALSNARNSIVTQISKDIESAIKKQSCEEMYKKKMMELSMVAIRQEAGNIKTICENSSQDNNKFVSDVVVELNRENIIKSIITQITNDNTLKGIFDVDKFKKSL